MPKKRRIKDYMVNEISLVDEPANRVPFLILKSRKEGDERMSKEVKEPGDKKEESSGDTGNSGAGDKKEELQKSSSPDLLQIVLKADGTIDMDSVPSTMKPAFEVLIKQQEELKKRAEDSEKLLKEEKAESQKRQWIEKAKEEYSYLPQTTPEEFGPILKRVSDSIPKEDMEKIQSILKSANAIVKASLAFDVIGGDKPYRGGSSYQQLEVIAKSLVEKDSNLTFEMAFAQAMKTNPKLYQEYLKEKKNNGN